MMGHYWTADDHPAARQAQIEDWLEDLDEFDVAIVRAACREWRQTQSRRPTPADIRFLAIGEVRRCNPDPEPVYLPPPEPKPKTAEDLAYVDRIMAAWRTGGGHYE